MFSSLMHNYRYGQWRNLHFVLNENSQKHLLFAKSGNSAR